MLRKSMGAVKDCASIGLAKMSSSKQIEILILKATSHADVPIDDGLIHRIIMLASCSSANAAACTSAVARRLGRTNDWIVALKCLGLVHRLLLHNHGDFFAYDGLSVIHRVFHKESIHKNSWDVVRTLASYLDERLRTTIFHDGNQLDLTNLEGLLERMRQWQRLLQRTRVMAPRGSAKRSDLVHASLQEVVRESFEGYKEVKKGLEVLVDRFPNMKKEECMEAKRIAIAALKQAGDLLYFYNSCMGDRNATLVPHVELLPSTVLKKLHGYLQASKEQEDDWEVALMESVKTSDGNHSRSFKMAPDDVNPFVEKTQFFF